MKTEARFLVDVGMKGLPFPIRVASRVQAEGQPTIADINISARIMHEFEAGWIDRFIQVLHEHRDRIGTKTLRTNIKDYMGRLHASMVRVDFEYPFFIEKRTPVSKEKCLVRYMCTCSARASGAEGEPPFIVGIQVPVLTTYPASSEVEDKGLFAQLSIVTIQVESHQDVFPEDLVDVVDRHALMPVYSYLTPEDQAFVIRKVHSEKKTSVVMTDEIKDDIRSNRAYEWYSVSTANFGMLHSYSTIIGTEKSMWVPFSGFEQEL